MNGVGTGSDKCLYLKVLFHVTEKGLDSPSVFVYCGNGGGPQGKVIGQKDSHFPGFGINRLDSPQGIGTFFVSADPG